MSDRRPNDASRHAPAKAGAYGDPSGRSGVQSFARPRVGAGFSRSRAAQAAFPVSSEDDSFVTRREFTKFLGLTSLAFFAGTFMAVGRKLWKRLMGRQADDIHVTALDELPVGQYKLFRYPTQYDPCILLRLDPEKLVAFNQNCTHLSCPVIFNAQDRQLECPCHKGVFSADDGRVIAGPPTRPLEALSVSVHDGRVWVKYESNS